MKKLLLILGLLTTLSAYGLKKVDADLFKAIEAGNIKQIRVALSYGAYINAVNEDECTPLYCAIYDQKTPIVKLLLQAGANPEEGHINTDDSVHSWYTITTPLELAEHVQNDTITALLLEYGAKALCRAVYEDNISLAIRLLDLGANVHERDNIGMTPLHYACKSRNSKSASRFELITALITHGADVNAQDEDGQTPLHTASKIRIHERDILSNIEKVCATQIQVIDLLLAHGAHLHAEDSNNRTPLSMACASRLHIYNVTDTDDSYANKLLRYYPNKISFIIASHLVAQGAHVNTSDSYIGTPLHFAASSHNQKLVSLLLDRGADKDAHNTTQETALHVACDSGLQWDNTQHLQDIELFDEEFISPIKTVERLLKAGAIVTAQDNLGNTPLHVATTYGYDEIAQLLIEYGADTSLLNNAGWTAQELAENCRYSYEFLSNAIRYGGEDQVEALLKYGTFSSQSEESPLRLAIELGKTKMVTLFLKYDDSFAIWEDDYLAAVSAGHKDIVELFLAIPDCNYLELQDSYGRSALHIAAGYGYADIVKLLLDHGADRSAYDWSYNLPKDLTSDKEILHLLETYH